MNVKAAGGAGHLNRGRNRGSREASAAARPQHPGSGLLRLPRTPAPADGVQAQSPGGAALRTARVCSPLQGAGRERAGARPLTPPLASPAWLTVGVSSRPWPGPDPGSLLYTLLSVFRATSKVEQKRLYGWSTWRAPTPPGSGRPSCTFPASSARRSGGAAAADPRPPQTPTCPGGRRGLRGLRTGSSHSEQNVDHAFLLSSASKLSEYFLLLEDNAFCAPSFHQPLQQRGGGAAVSALAFLEFANLGVLGKLFRSSGPADAGPLPAPLLPGEALDRLLAHFRGPSWPRRTPSCARPSSSTTGPPRPPNDR